MATPGPDSDIKDDELLRFIHLLYGPTAGTADVADYFSYTPEGMRKHLERLVDAGLLACRKHGNANVWWLTDAGRRRISPVDVQDSVDR